MPGLEVLDNATEEWVDAESAATCGVTGRDGRHKLLIFAGDSLEDWFGVAAAQHRVMRDVASRARLSLVYEMRTYKEEDEVGGDGEWLRTLCPTEQCTAQQGQRLQKKRKHC